MDKQRLVILGSCSVDFATYAERLPNPGETLHGYKFTTSNGGKGANQCIAAAKLGASTAMIAKVGGDIWGGKYIQYFNDNGIDTTFMRIAPNESTGIAQINVSKSGENQIVIVAGSNNTLSAEDVSDAKDYITNASVLVCQLETPVETTLRAFEICKGIKILNAAPGMENISHKLLSLTTILCVNESEAAIITGKPIVSTSDVANGIENLLKFGCDIVIITLGENGAAFATRKEPAPLHVLCEKIVPVDSTGAGDAFIGALATLVAQGCVPLPTAVGAACRVATLSVTKEGTQTSYPRMDINKLVTRDYQIKNLI